MSWFSSKSKKEKKSFEAADSQISLSNEYLRNQNHVFIFGLCGRSASTALQRILNSSDDVCIWGESWGTIDHLLHAYFNLKGLVDTYSNGDRETNVEIFKHSFINKSHNQWYATAFPQLNSKVLSNIENEIIHLLYDKEIGITRFGFKDIGLYKEDVLECISKFFPNSRILFIFRNPLSQWISVRNAGYWPYSNSVIAFTQKYAALAEKYYAFSRANETSIFFENTDLADSNVISKLVETLDMSKYDDDLINNKVNSTASNTLNADDEVFINNSKAMEYYKLIVKNKFTL